MPFFSADLIDNGNLDVTLYHFPCANYTATAATLNSNAITYLCHLHVDKNHKLEYTEVNPLAQSVRLTSHIKRVQANPVFRVVYDHCGIPGFRHILAHRHRCIACVPMEPTGRPLKQRPVEYPQLHLLPSLSP